MGPRLLLPGPWHDSMVKATVVSYSGPTLALDSGHCSWRNFTLVDSRYRILLRRAHSID